MPSARRKEQNRLNQRRYRLQMKNRIQLLEQAVATAREAVKEPSVASDKSSEFTAENHASMTRTPFDDFEEVERFAASTDILVPGTALEINSTMDSNQDLSQFSGLAQFNAEIDNSLCDLSGSSFLENMITPNTIIDLDASGKLVSPSHMSSEDGFFGFKHGFEREESGKKDGGVNLPVGKITFKRTTSDERDLITNLREDNRRLQDLNLALLEGCTCGGFSHNATRDKTYESSSEEGINTNHTQDTTLNRQASTYKSYSSSSTEPTDSPTCSPDLWVQEYSNLDHIDSHFSSTNGGILGIPTVQSSPEWYASAYDTTSETPQVNLPPSTTSPYTSLPLPRTYASLEPSFSRRLLRTIYESGFYILCNQGQFPPLATNRIFDFCLSHNTISSIMDKISRSLGLGSGGIMMVDQLRWGLIPDRRDSGEEKDLMEVGDIEWLLLERGFMVTPDGQVVFVTSNSRAVSGGFKKPTIPYGTVSKTVKLDAWTHAAVPHFGSVVIPDALERDTIPKANQDMDASEPPKCTPFLGGYGNPIDIERLIYELVGRAICLGRTAGFRVSDVLEVLEEYTEPDH